MRTIELEETARRLVADGKGILAADETPPTLTKRLAAREIESTPTSRRDYREMFFTTPGIAEYISGVILQDETIRQTSDEGIALAELLSRQSILPGIKVDNGAKPLAAAPGERVTEGLDGLRARLEDYRNRGARFAKWRAVIAIDGSTLPSEKCVHVNAHALGRYAALCQEQQIVPIVEPEVLMDGSHTIERCEEVTGAVLRAVFRELFAQGVAPEAMLLKPSMVVAGKDCPTQPSVDEVARATLRCLRRHVPAAIPGIVFLSGGQDHVAATAHLSAINAQEGTKPWKLSFSYGRALQDEALEAWRGRRENVAAAQRAFLRRAKCDSAAALGRYTPAMESKTAA
ncbi:MAG TPA: class I fructose-bisphosphate aldolase [Gammaproteobacteria bacterium]|nr:class I fructose-bisphosphate aldolase [Gammaproteobacteria bacterium]